MSLATIVVAGTVTAPDGTNYDGKTIWFTSTAEMRDVDGNVLYPITRVKARVVDGQLLAGDGESPLTLAASDNGVTTVPYTVEETWQNGRRFGPINLLTTDADTGEIDYSGLGPISPAPTPTSPYALAGDVAESVATLQAEIDSIGPGGGGTESVAGVDPVAGDVPAADLAAALETAGLAPTAVVAAEQARAQAIEALKADLVAGKVPLSQLPASAFDIVTHVATITDMLALSTGGQGAFVKVADDGDGEQALFLLPAGDDPTDEANWLEVNFDPDGAAAAAQTAAEAYADRYAGSMAGTSGRPLAATDPTTTNARTPTGHHATHSTGGTDPITPADIGADTPSARDNAIADQHTADAAAFAPITGSGAYAPLDVPTTLAGLPTSGQTTGSLRRYWAADDNGGAWYQDQAAGVAPVKVTRGLTESAATVWYQEIVPAGSSIAITATGGGANVASVPGGPLLLGVTLAATTNLDFEVGIPNAALSASGGILIVEVVEGSNIVMSETPTAYTGSANLPPTVLRRLRFSAASGSHNYEVKLACSGSLTATLAKGGGTPPMPAIYFKIRTSE